MVGVLGGVEGCRDLGRGAFALDRGGVQGNGQMRRAPCQGGQHITQGSGLRAGDDGDTARKGGQGAFLITAEQSLCFQAGLEFKEAFKEPALAGLAQGFHIQLVVAPGFIKGGEGASFHLLAIFRPESQQLGFVAPEGAAHLGAGILEGEIEVAGGRPAQVGDFSADPGQGQAALQQGADDLVELADAQDGRRWVFRDIVKHGAQFTPQPGLPPLTGDPDISRKAVDSP